MSTIKVLAPAFFVALNSSVMHRKRFVLVGSTANLINEMNTVIINSLPGAIQKANGAKRTSKMLCN